MLSGWQTRCVATTRRGGRTPIKHVITLAFWCGVCLMLVVGHLPKGNMYKFMCRRDD